MDQNFAESKRFRLFCTIVLTILAVIALLPILLIVIASVPDEKALLANGYTFFPAKLSTDSYYYMVRQGSMIVRSYGITILTTVVGTAAGVLFTTMLAYPMARSSFSVPSLEPSSTNTYSQVTPISATTCSVVLKKTGIASSSLKQGTTMDRSTGVFLMRVILSYHRCRYECPPGSLLFSFLAIVLPAVRCLRATSS